MAQCIRIYLIANCFKCVGIGGKGMNNTKSYIPFFDFMRAVCAIGIVINHYSRDTGGIIPFDVFPMGGGSWGYTIVTVFFLMSGALLYLNDSYIGIKEFYKKRWNTIFPAFYISYVTGALMLVLSGEWSSIFMGRKVWIIILSVFGFDKYFSDLVKPFNIVGEWFLGAIILIYIIYPVLRWMYRKNPEICLIIFGILFLLLGDWNILHNNSFRSPISCVVTFLIGMEIMRSRLYENKLLTYFAILVFPLICIMPGASNLNFNILCHISGMMLFFVLCFVGTHVMNYKLANKAILWISKISYEVFLIQHLVIKLVIKLFHPLGDTCVYIFLICTVLCSLTGAFVLHRLTKWTMQSMGNMIHKIKTRR